jgi:S1-C subfamily serine protease
LRIVVGGAGTINGRVVDHATGAPIAGARIETAYGHTTSSESGAFTVAGLVPGSMRIMIEADGYARDLRSLQSVLGGGAVDVGSIHLLRSQPLQMVAYDGIDPVSRDGRAFVNDVSPGSPAALAGIQAGDALLTVNGNDVRLLGPDAINVLLAGKPNDSVTVTYTRAGGSPSTATLRLAPINAR